MKILKLIAVISILTVFTSCLKNNDCVFGNGNIITQEITLPPFSKFESFGENNIIVTQGSVQKVIVSGYPNIIDKLSRSVIDGNWKMIFEDNDCYKNAGLNVLITVPVIEKIDLFGNGKIKINGFECNSKNLSLNLSGSGDFELNSNSGTENLNINIDGSGNIVGLTDFEHLENLNLTIRGNGDYSALPLKTENAIIRITGNGNSYIYANTTINAVIDGSGIIYYKGNPTITKNIKGTGKIINYN